jgi:hypothetical protein
MDKRLVHSDDWRGYADSTYFKNNYIFAEEPISAFDATRSTNNFIESNLFVGNLIFYGNGFKKHNGKFDKTMWYDPRDENWNKLIEFVKEKKVVLKGTEVFVLDVIGF